MKSNEELLTLDEQLKTLQAEAMKYDMDEEGYGIPEYLAQQIEELERKIDQMYYERYGN